MASDKIAFQHPAIMPDKLARDHILTWSNSGDTVYDPFAGSGTVLKQAKILNRNFIGSEINPDYCKIIKARLNTMEDYIWKTYIPPRRLLRKRNQALTPWKALIGEKIAPDFFLIRIFDVDFFYNSRMKVLV